MSANQPRSSRQINHRHGIVVCVQPAMDLIPRHAQTAVTAALSDTRVVVINGARQTGKSTLARLVMANFPGSELRFLDEAPVRAAALADPALFLRHSGLLVIDEGQRAPDLFLSTNHHVATHPPPSPLPPTSRPPPP